MTALLLIVPLLFALVAGPAAEPTDTSPPPVVQAAVVAVPPVARTAAVAVPPPVEPDRGDAGRAAYEAAESHLAAGRLPIAAHYFQQAARLGHRPAESHAALAYTYFRMDNPALGDVSLDQALAGGALPGSPWMVAAGAERKAMDDRRRQMDEFVNRLTSRSRSLAAMAPKAAIPPAPASASVTKFVESSPGQAPGTLLAARGCKVLLVAGDQAPGHGLATARALAAHGAEIDCLASIPGAPPARNEVWFQPDQQDQARQIADNLPGGAVLLRNEELRNGIEVRLVH